MSTFEPFDGDMHEGLRGAAHEAVARGRELPRVAGKKPCAGPYAKVPCGCVGRCWWHGPVERADAFPAGSPVGPSLGFVLHGYRKVARR